MPKKKAAAKRPARATPRDQRMRTLMHELQVYTEEVTTQNEQLLRAQVDLEQARDRFADLYDFAPIGYLSMDVHGTIREINLGGAALFGKARARLIDMPLPAMIEAGDDVHLQAFLSEARAHSSGPTPQVELRVRHAPRRVRLLALPRTVDGGAELFTAIFDVTDEHRLVREREDALVRERVRTSELSREVDDRLAAEAQIKKLLERVVSVQEEERHRIARNLHDHLGQQLTALRLTLGTLKDHELPATAFRERLETVEKLVEALDRDVDFLAWGLRPVALDDTGLPAALTEFLRQWSISTGIPSEFHASSLGTVRLSTDSESNLYRIVQEAMNNIAKHAGATHASVLLERRGEEVMLIVEDDGRGFDHDRAWNNRTRHGGMGLIGMHERAALVGGQVQFESSPGSGTTLFVRIPLELRPPRGESEPKDVEPGGI